MHFWINKSSQQGWRQGHICALRRPIPPAVVAAYYKRHHQGTRGRPMVTPVRRFQSLDSVVNNGLRHGGRPQQYHHPIRSSGNHVQPMHYNFNATTPVQHSERSTEGQVDPLEDIGELPMISKCKCLVYMFFVLIVMVAVTNYFVYGYPFVMGQITFMVVSSVSGILLLIAGSYFFVFKDLWEIRRESRLRRQQLTNNTEQNQQPQVVVEEPPPPPLQDSTEDPSEIPPPPYHIAILLSPQSDLDTIDIIQDQSPPPSYEKAVT
ncbi:uncharacterized protein LOC132698978 isoform X2 [Cylas formicarius]|uniref:uncharacterized protein LOC132698978 isoform X2 n=1 Tax=Cylas formicarius TaxID=197179 RepID=UPI00295899CA|nr:uncharacterized protein LOC132698978 isoform X2 [Cylas formicarius]